eukprot:TRINITY_DN22449_c0_g1_i1.p1 TRINITY_DN22449_c0_g1~~TRINITY_DN22449_c0_g1_i1.p1  ORF type:complete len:610 (-),score=82.06 TRINITY_DN22449_c0_g1_i1:36-1670(-)
MTHLPAGDHNSSERRDIWEFGTGRYMGSIPEAAHTYNVIGNMNEFQVSIGETTFDGVEKLASQPGAVIDYYSLMWIALQRSRTAREAILNMEELTATHGYASTGESFSITDPNEAWVMELIGRGPGEKGAVWVARRIPDGYVGAHANQARIRTFPRDSKDTLYSPDIVAFAKSKGLYPQDGTDEDFSFADVFDPITPVSARSCEARVWDMFRRVTYSGFEDQYLDYVQGVNLSNRMPLFVKVKTALHINDTMWITRSHYEGSWWFDARNDLGAVPFHSPDRVRPLGFEVNGDQYMFNRNIGYIGTFFHFVANARGTIQPTSETGPTCAGGVIWFGVDDASLSVRVPMYACTQSAPANWAFGFGSTGHYEQKAAFWAFNMVANFAYSRWNLVGAEVQRRVVETEDSELRDLSATDRKYVDMLKSGSSNAAITQFLSEFSLTNAAAIIDKWVALFPELFVKYRDYLVASPAPAPAHPRDQPPPPNCEAVGYEDSWYRAIVAATGERYKVPAAAGSALASHQTRKMALLMERSGGAARTSPFLQLAV